MCLDIFGHALNRVQNLTAFTRIFDLDPIIALHQYHQFQRINAVEAQAFSEEWRIVVYIFRFHALQVKTVYDLLLERGF